MVSQEEMYAVFLDVQSDRMTFEQFEEWVSDVHSDGWESGMDQASWY